MIPNVSIKRQDGATGVVRPGAAGILAIIAASYTGTVNQPASYTSPEAIETDFGAGRLASFAAHDLDVTGNPVVAIKPTTAVAATYGAMTVTGGGSSVPTAGATSPLDEWAVVISFSVGATVGVAGAMYAVSLDNGNTYGASTALGTANTIAISGTGITVSLGAGTILANQTIQFVTTPAYPNSTDLPTALEALRVTKLPWDAVLVDVQGATGSAAIAAQLDTWLQGLEAVGVFKSALMNLPMKQIAPYGTGETEAAYNARLQTLMTGANPLRVIVCEDGADMVEHFQGVNVRRPTALYVAAEGESLAIGQDVAAVANGSLTNCSIDDARGNTKYHDEQLYPGGDAQGFATLRSFPGRDGAYITNALIIAGVNGSDYVYWQQLRVMNAACTLAYQLLTNKLSQGVRKNPQTGPNGAVYIAEADAASIEQYVNAQLEQQLKGQVTDVGIVLSRTDDISSNAGALISVTLDLEALAYIKGFAVAAGFVKSFTVPLAA